MGHNTKAWLVVTLLTATLFAVGQSVVVDGSSARWAGHSLVRFSDAETPAGTIDGINVVFTLAHAPYPPASLILVRNGVVMKQGLDYAVAGTTVVFVAGQVPTEEDILLAWYRWK
ncbi:MAG: hypothetical protein ACE15B_19540 [Bryobacteraceae bacterium]